MKRINFVLGMYAVFGVLSATNIASRRPELHQLGEKMPAEKIAIPKAMRAPAKVSSVDEVLGNYQWIGYSALVDSNGNAYEWGQGDLQLAKVDDKVLAYGLNTLSDVEIEASIDVAAGTVSLPAKVLLAEQMDQGTKVQTYLVHMKWDMSSQQPVEAGVPLVLNINTDGELQYTSEEDLYGIAIYQTSTLNITVVGYYYLFYYNQFKKRPEKLSNVGWEDYGTAKVSQNWFSENPDYNLKETEYNIKVQRKIDDKNIIRVVNPYGAGTPFERYNLSAAEGAIEFDISNPECVVTLGVSEQLLGTNQSGEEIFCKMGNWAGFMTSKQADYPLNMANHFIVQGLTKEDIINEFGTESLSTYNAETKTIVVKDALFTSSIDVSKGTVYNGWTEANQMGIPTFVITEGSDVGDIEIDDDTIYEAPQGEVRRYSTETVSWVADSSGELKPYTINDVVTEMVFCDNGDVYWKNCISVVGNGSYIKGVDKDGVIEFNLSQSYSTFTDGSAASVHRLKKEKIDEESYTYVMDTGNDVVRLVKRTDGTLAADVSGLEAIIGIANSDGTWAGWGDFNIVMTPLDDAEDNLYGSIIHEAPQGEVRYYDTASDVYFINSNGQSDYGSLTGADTEMVFCDNGEVYWKNCISMAGTDTYIKGVVKDDVIEFSFPQSFAPFSIGSIAYVHRMKAGPSGSAYIIDTDNDKITFIKSPDGSLTADLNVGEIIGITNSKGEWVEWGDGNIVMTLKTAAPTMSVNAPTIEFDTTIMKVVITKDDKEGVATYYTIDNTEPTTASIPYIEPFALTADAVVRAKSFCEGYSPSKEAAPLDYRHSDYITLPPTFKIEGKIVTLTPQTAGSNIYYGIDDNNPENFILYENPVEVNKNCMLYVQARMEGMYDSEIVSHEINDQRVMTPNWSFDPELHLLTIDCVTEGAVISYSDDMQQTWKEYADPIHVKGNATYYAKASAPDLLDSEVVPIVISEFKCAAVTAVYNGRHVALKTDEVGATIFYSLDGSEPSMVYDNEPVDVSGLVTLRAVAKKEGFNDSEVMTYEVKYYADEEHAVVGEAGNLANSFGWATDSELALFEDYSVEGPLNEADYAVFGKMNKIRHLDLENVTTTAIPGGDFSGLPLVSISLPKEVGSYGDALFDGCELLSSVVCNSTAAVTDGVLSGASNPNLLLYVTGTTQANWNNVVRDGVAQMVTLTDGKPFHAVREFTATEITYAHDFTKQSGMGSPAGWEALTVPFDVQSIADASGAVIKPFLTANESDRKFWLYSPTASGWERAGGIEAFGNYIVSMPNHPWHGDDVNISGKVTFSARNVTVARTPSANSQSFKDNTWLVSAYMPVEKSANVSAINDETTADGDVPGSCFVKNLRDVRPFECYLTGENLPAKMPIFDSSDIEELMGDGGFRVWSEGRDICIYSPLSIRVMVHDYDGRLMRVASVRGGETTRLTDFNAGIYIVGDTKIYVK